MTDIAERVRDIRVAVKAAHDAVLHEQRVLPRLLAAARLLMTLLGTSMERAIEHTSGLPNVAWWSARTPPRSQTYFSTMDSLVMLQLTYNLQEPGKYRARIVIKNGCTRDPGMSTYHILMKHNVPGSTVIPHDKNPRWIPLIEAALDAAREEAGRGV